MEQFNTTGSSEAESGRQFYLPAVSPPSGASAAERFLTRLFRQRGELLARVVRAGR